jgi:hypothetical protein
MVTICVRTLGASDLVTVTVGPGDGVVVTLQTTGSALERSTVERGANIQPTVPARATAVRTPVTAGQW